ncbi:MAG: hypothetical protein NVS9B12_01600 [Vulcanimicrobiaceae bacterium]
MQKFTPAALAAAFAAAASLAMLGSGAQQLAQKHPSMLSAAPTVALADQERDNEDNQGGNAQGDNAHNCTNPAGQERGWCKHNREDRDRDDRRHHRHSAMLVSGTVQSINGTTVYFLRNNGQPLTFLDNNGTRFNVGQRVTVRLYNVNGQLALAPNGYNNNGGYNNGGYNNGGYGNNPSQNNRQVNGVILAVSGSTLTFINGTSIDISQAQQRGAINGSLSIGRSIIAYGFVDQTGRFHATSIQ